MKKPKKIIPLEEGQRIWIESKSYHRGTSSIQEYQIVKVNKSSAYAVRVSDLEKEKVYPIRIEQKTRKVDEKFATIYSYYVWETKEDFERSVKHEEESILMRKQAIEKVKKMNFEQLKEFLSN